MGTLYELKAAWADVYAMADDPDIDDQVWFDTLEAIEGEVEDKADGYAKIIKEINADSDKLKAEIERLTARKKALDNTVDRLKESLKQAMELTGKVKFKTELFSFGIQQNGGKTPIILKVDEREVPIEFQRVTYKVDNDAIRKALDAGEYIGFAEYGERGTSLRIR